MVVEEIKDIINTHHSVLCCLFGGEESDAVLIETQAKVVMVAETGVRASHMAVLDWWGSAWPSEARVCWSMYFDHR